MLTKTEAKRIQEPFEFSGAPVSTADCHNWRRLAEYEVHRCGRHIGEDIQSGRILCGDIADYTAATPSGGSIYTCEGHTPREHRKAAKPAGGTQ